MISVQAKDGWWGGQWEKAIQWCQHEKADFSKLKQLHEAGTRKKGYKARAWWSAYVTKLLL